MEDVDTFYLKDYHFLAYNEVVNNFNFKKW